MKTIKLKKIERDPATRSLMIFGGVSLLIFTSIYSLICIALMFIIIGFFMFPAGIIPLMGGFGLLNSAKYENEKITCPYCKAKSETNFGIIKDNAFDCKTCKQRILVK